MSIQAPFAKLSRLSLNISEPMINKLPVANAAFVSCDDQTAAKKVPPAARHPDRQTPPPRKWPDPRGFGPDQPFPRTASGGGVGDRMGRCHALTLGTAALLTINHSPNRRTLQFPVMSGKVALSDIVTSPQTHQPVVLVSSVGMPGFMRFRTGIYETGCAGICETGAI